jgi:succinate dehydrogenase / fumarate reductase, cytochrome b subunit
VNRKRPVNLDLTTIKQPPTAIASILHRISGVLVFFLIPFVLWMFDRSLNSQHDFDSLRDALASPFLTLLLWALLAGLIYHLLAGIRHLLMDMHILSEDFSLARKTAVGVIILSVVLFVVMGVLLW